MKSKNKKLKCDMLLFLSITLVSITYTYLEVNFQQYFIILVRYSRFAKKKSREVLKTFFHSRRSWLNHYTIRKNVLEYAKVWIGGSCKKKKSIISLCLQKEQLWTMDLLQTRMFLLYWCYRRTKYFYSA